jgi:hypothetical protein
LIAALAAFIAGEAASIARTTALFAATAASIAVKAAPNAGTTAATAATTASLAVSPAFIACQFFVIPVTAAAIAGPFWVVE